MHKSYKQKCSKSIEMSLTTSSLSQSQGYSAFIIHPCYPAGHSVTMKLSSIFDSPCSGKYRALNYNPESSLSIRGTGHYKECLGNVSEIFSFDKCDSSQCSFDNVYQPNVTGRFVVRPTGQTYTHKNNAVLTGKFSTRHNWT